MRALPFSSFTMKHAPLSSIVQGGGKRRRGVGAPSKFIRPRNAVAGQKLFYRPSIPLASVDRQ